LVCRLQTYDAWIISLTIRNELPHPFSQEAAAENNCLKASFKRRPRISVKPSQGVSLIKSYSNRKYKSRQVCLAAQSLNLEIQFLSAPMMPMMMTAVIAYFSMVYLLKTNVGGGGGSSAHGAKDGVTVTVLGTQIMLISFVTWALIVKNICGICMSSHIMQ
jgi:hypothetical protein